MFVCGLSLRGYGRSFCWHSVLLVLTLGFAGASAVPAQPARRLNLGRERAVASDCEIHSVAFSPDGKTLAAAGTVGDDANGVAYLYNTTTLKVRAPLRSDDPMQCVAFSPDGKVLVTGGVEQHARLWYVATGKGLGTLKHPDFVESLAYSADGHTLATGGFDGTVRLWDCATWKQSSVWTNPDRHAVKGVAFSPDGKTLAAASEKIVVLWDVATGKPRHTLRGHREDIWSIAFSLDGKLLASGGADETVRLWDPATGKELAVRKAHDEIVCAVAFHPSGRWLVTGGIHHVGRPGEEENSGEIKVWDVATRRVVQTVAAHTLPTITVAFSLDGKTLAAGSCDKKLKLWDVSLDGK